MKAIYGSEGGGGGGGGGTKESPRQTVIAQQLHASKRMLMFLKVPAHSCHKCDSNLAIIKVDSRTPAASESLFDDKRPSGLRDMKTFII